MLVLVLVSGADNDVADYAEVVERSLVHEGRKRYFMVEFPREPDALHRFLNDVLGTEEDITYFEYVKRSSRDTGPAVVGIELGHPADYRFLLQRTTECGFSLETIASNSPFFKFLMYRGTPFPAGDMIYWPEAANQALEGTMTRDLTHLGVSSNRQCGPPRGSTPRLLASLLVVLALLSPLTSCSSPSDAPEPGVEATTQVVPTAASDSTTPASGSDVPEPGIEATTQVAPTAASDSTTPASESTLSAETILTFQGAGPITLGTSAEELIRLGLFKEGDECGHDPIGLAEQLGTHIEATPDGDVFAVLIIEPSPLRTEAGAELGMGFGALREIYGQAMTDEIKEGNGGPFPVTVVRNGPLEMVFMGGWEDETTVPERVEDNATVATITVREASPDMFAGGGC